MLLPENFAFLMGAIANGAQVSVNVTQTNDPRKGEVTNINNNINFYGPVTLPQNDIRPNVKADLSDNEASEIQPVRKAPK